MRKNNTKQYAHSLDGTRELCDNKTGTQYLSAADQNASRQKSQKNGTSPFTTLAEILSLRRRLPLLDLA